MKIAAFAAVLIAATAAQAQPSAPQPGPDMNKPVTITLAQLQRIVAAARAEGQTACLSQMAQPDMEELIRQATPPAAEPPKP